VVARGALAAVLLEPYSKNDDGAANNVVAAIITFELRRSKLHSRSCLCWLKEEVGNVYDMPKNSDTRCPTIDHGNGENGSRTITNKTAIDLESVCVLSLNFSPVLSSLCSEISTVALAS
jgi:hypothetical protein